MSKSNATEIIAILWLLAAMQTDGVAAKICGGFFALNIIESIYWAFKHPINQQ